MDNLLYSWRVSSDCCSFMWTFLSAIKIVRQILKSLWHYLWQRYSYGKWLFLFKNQKSKMYPLARLQLWEEWGSVLRRKPRIGIDINLYICEILSRQNIFATIIFTETEVKIAWKKCYSFQKKFSNCYCDAFYESANIFLSILCDVLPNLCTCIAETFLVATCYEVQTFWYLAKIHLIQYDGSRMAECANYTDV